MKVALIYSFILISTIQGIQSQNLVENWSFEDTIPCVNNPLFGAPETAPPWYSINESPDYFSLNYCGGGGIAFGYQIPKSGNAIVGFSVYNPFIINGSKEIFGQQLQDSLISGHKYCVSFYVSCADEAQYATDRISALFTDFYVDDAYISSFVAIPQIQNSVGNIISDTANWVQISGDFVAQGGEKYISIGNIIDNANIQVTLLPWGNLPFSYYYIDDISVIDCTVGQEELMSAYINIYPNPVSDHVLIKGLEKLKCETHVQIYTV